MVCTAMLLVVKEDHEESLVVEKRSSQCGWLAWPVAGDVLEVVICARFQARA